MQRLDRYVSQIVARLDSDDQIREEPDLEIKSEYPSKAEAEALWGIADLLAALANSAGFAGPRALVYGPSPSLARPKWFSDEAVVADRLRRHFDGAVMPRFEVLRRRVGGRGEADIFVLLDCSETPYVTRHQPGGFWVVRTRSNTARRTARRSELFVLCSQDESLGPTASIEASVGFGSGDIYLIEVANTGSVAVRDVRVIMPESQSILPLDWKSGDVVIEELRPSEVDNARFMATNTIGMLSGSIRAEISGTADDGMKVKTTVVIDPLAL